MSNEVNSKYDVTDLTSLEKLEPVRIRPGMYIGSTGTKGLHHCIWEILDNSIDEISNGFGNKATIIINKDKSVTVIDNGRGSLIIRIIKLLEDFMELVLLLLMLYLSG